jgi:hypothetical protein
MSRFAAVQSAAKQYNRMAHPQGASLSHHAFSRTFYGKKCLTPRTLFCTRIRHEIPFDFHLDAPANFLPAVNISCT